MQISARNKLKGTISEIKQGKVNSEVIVKLPSGDLITAIITNEGCENLGLKEGIEATAIIKASYIMIAKDDCKVSCRNKLLSEITSIKDGEVNSEVNFSNDLHVIITKDAKEELDLKVGESVYAIFKASSVILGL